MSGKEVKVWDPFVRVFHWSLVLSFLVAYLTEDEWLSLHVNAGYAVLGLVGLRVVWGFIGTRHARFSDFVYRPAHVRAYIRDTLNARAQRYIGHNPAGGAMIVLMMAGLLLTAISGIAVHGLEQGAGPMSGLYGLPETVENVVEAVHEFLANLMVLMVVVV